MWPYVQHGHLYKTPLTLSPLLERLKYFSVSFIVHSMYLKSTDRTVCIYFDFVLRSERSLIEELHGKTA